VGCQLPLIRDLCDREEVDGPRPLPAGPDPVAADMVTPVTYSPGRDNRACSLSRREQAAELLSGYGTGPLTERRAAG